LHTSENLRDSRRDGIHTSGATYPQTKLEADFPGRRAARSVRGGIHVDKRP
jgi:hypothetical protein